MGRVWPPPCWVIGLLGLVGCGARPECIARVSLSDLDEPIGAIGPVPQVIDVDSYERWVVYAQPRRDTDGDGSIESGRDHHGELLGDAFEVLVDRVVAGRHVERSIDAFLGERDEELYVLVDDEVIALRARDDSERRVATIAPVPRPTALHTLGQSWDVDLAEAGVVAWRSTPSTVDVLDLRTGRSQRIETDRWISSVTLGPEGTTLAIDLLEEAPRDPSQERSLPHTQMSGAVRPCRGVACDGPAYTTRIYRLDVASAAQLVEIAGPRSVRDSSRRLWLRPWGVVLEDPPNGFLVRELYGEAIDSPCVLTYVGLSSPALTVRCSESEPLRQILVTPTETRARTPFDAEDVDLLRREDVRRALLSEPRTLDVREHRGGWWIPALDLEWTPATRTWRTRHRGCPPDVLAVRDDGWYLTIRQAAATETSGACGHSELAQLVWTGPLPVAACVEPAETELDERPADERTSDPARQGGAATDGPREVSPATADVPRGIGAEQFGGSLQLPDPFGSGLPR